jgi:hypothetical protein
LATIPSTTLAMVMKIPENKKGILLFSGLVFLFIISPIMYPKAHGQIIPLPFPGSGKKIHQNDKSVQNDYQPPVIHFITNILETGNNVLKMTVTDQSYVDICKVSYYRDGKRITQDCVKDQDHAYKALVYMDSPTPHSIEVLAKDGNGNGSALVKQLNVQPEKNLFQKIFDFLFHLV